MAAVLEQRGRLPAHEAIDWVLQALEAVAQAHALGMVHRDLKPGNLFLASKRDGGQVVKVLDFGISKQNPLTTASPGVVTATASVMGSPAYMAPEQLRNAKGVEARADIWAIGVVLYELLAGRPPFTGETIAELFVAVLEQTPAPLRTWLPDVAPGLEAVVMRCLAHRAEERFPNVADLAEALAPFAAAGKHPSVARVRAHVSAGPTDATRSAPDAQPSRLPAAPPPQTGAHWTTEGRQAARSGRSAWFAVLGAGIVAAIGIAATGRSVVSTQATQAPPPPSASLVAPAVPSPPSAPEPVVGLPILPTGSELPADVPPPAPFRAVPAKSARSRASGAPTPPAARPAPVKPNCKPNFYLDDQGEKHFKPECFPQ